MENTIIKVPSGIEAVLKPYKTYFEEALNMSSVRHPLPGDYRNMTHLLLVDKEQMKQLTDNDMEFIYMTYFNLKKK